MLGLIGSLRMGARSLAAQRQGVEVAGHNLANVNNTAYARQRVAIQSTTSGDGINGPVGSEAEVTAIRQIRDQRITAVFLENMTDPRMVERIAQETGAKVGGTLYGDALGGSVTTYLDMMRHNARAIAGALK